MEKASKEWWHQRLTACLAVVGCVSACGIFACLKMKKSSLLDGLFSIMVSPFGAVFAIMIFFAVMYHGAIGMKIIIEDYVQKPFLRKISINLIFLFTYFIIGIVTLTIITINVKYAILHP